MSAELTNEPTLVHRRWLRKSWLAAVGLTLLILAIAMTVALTTGAARYPLQRASAPASALDASSSEVGHPLWVATGAHVRQVRVSDSNLRFDNLLAQAGVARHPLDMVKIGANPLQAIAAIDGAPLPAEISRVQVLSVVPFVLRQDGVQSVLHAPATTVGDALYRAGVTVYAGDKVQPSLDTPLVAGMHVHLTRSIPVTILADVRVKTRSQGAIVADALAQEGIVLNGNDRTEIAPDAPLEAGQVISITRVVQEWIVDAEIIPYKTIWRADAELEIDTQRIDQAGHDGIRKKRYQITYENGVEVARVLEQDWIEQEPTTRIIAYGTKIVLREVETPEGVKQYWRKFRVLATSYTAATSGKTRDHPHYGITFMGWRARKGIIAVDPRVIPLTADMYVPGYGVGIAGDTGGAIKGLRIDLCYEEYDLVLWKKWVDVYLLTPIPPRNQINWMLPSWPVER